MQGPNPLPHVGATLFPHLPTRGNTLAVKFANSHCRLADRGAIDGIDRLTAFIPLVSTDLEAVEVRAVEFLHAGEQALVAFIANTSDDLRDVLLDVVTLDRLPIAEHTPLFCEVRVLGPKHSH